MEKSISCNDKEMKKLYEFFLAMGHILHCIKFVTNCNKLFKFILSKEKKDEKNKKITSAFIVLLGLCICGTIHVTFGKKFLCSFYNTHHLKTSNVFGQLHSLAWLRHNLV